MFYQEKVINGVLCCRYAPNSKWVEVDNKTLTDRLMKYKNALYIIKNFSEDDELKYGDPGVVASEVLSID